MSQVWPLGFLVPDSYSIRINIPRSYKRKREGGEGKKKKGGEGEEGRGGQAPAQNAGSICVSFDDLVLQSPDSAFAGASRHRRGEGKGGKRGREGKEKETPTPTYEATGLTLCRFGCTSLLTCIERTARV